MSQTRFETWHLDLQNRIGKLHFDIRHPNTLPWKTPEDLSANLAKRILAVVGAGPNITPAT